MSTYAFGPASQRELATCCEELRRVATRALGYGIADFSITQGRRSTKEQMRLYRENKTTLDGVTKKSKHQADAPELSDAFDFMPYPGRVNGVSVWDDRQRFCVIAGLFYAAAQEEGVTIRWGGDWDCDGNNADSNFHDMPHIEIVR